VGRLIFKHALSPSGLQVRCGFALLSSLNMY
jgi:hypothetical protein